MAAGWLDASVPRPSNGGNAPQRPGDPPPVRAEITLTVRWSSALPIRQAAALDRWGKSGLSQKHAQEFLREEPDHVIEVFGLPAILVRDGAEQLEKDFRGTASLVGKSREPVQVRGVSIPGQGMHLSAEFRFPRSARLTEQDGAIRFVAVSPATRIDVKFNLAEMLYEGRLAT